MEIRILLRKQQLYDKFQNPVILSGTNPQNIITSPGQLSLNPWVDYTEDCSGLNKLKLTWTEDEKLEANDPLNNNFKKASSGTLTFERDAYTFIREWLWDDVAAPLNAVEAKIIDTSCGSYEEWSFRNTQIQYCENGLCQYNVNLKQKDELFHCIQTTLINDNWQNWFQIQPANGKKHPRFSYCNEQRPNGTMTMLWWLTGQIIGPLMPVIIGVILLLNSIIFAINGIIAVINALGGNVTPINFINPALIIQSFNQYYVESAGCGREHPAPLIRDYITNVCDKCGITVDSVTAPIFFANTLTIETSDPNRGQGGVIQADNPHYNACYLFPRYKRGIRRFYNLNFLSAPNPNNVDFWIPDNAPNIALSDFLSELAGLYNAEWRIRSGSLYFWRKDWFKNGNPVYDFTENSADRLKLIDGICYEWNEVKYPAYVDGLYSNDAADTCGNEVLGQMNGPAYSFTTYENQPNFGGPLDKKKQFGGTRENLDGSQTCYYYDAMQVVANGGALSPFLPFQMATIAQAFRDYADYALVLRDETVSLPKVIIWDGEEYLNAKAIHNKAAYPNVAPQPIPEPNPAYNKSSLPWYVLHPPQTFVIGSGLTIPQSPQGIYRVEDYFGNLITENPAILMNYPMYFNPGFYDTMWDWFHWIDDPRGNPILNQRFRLKILYCCEDAKKLGLLNDASDAQLGQSIKVPASSFYQDAQMKEITVSFDDEDTFGKYIEISGIV